jgi:hypothetical protein
VNGSVVDEDVDQSVPIASLAYASRSLIIVKIAAERRHSTPWTLRSYLARLWSPPHMPNFQ